MENLELWNRVDKTDPAITKRAKIGGNSITAIDPQFQRKAATEQFGPFGIGWGVTDEEWSYLDIADTKLCHYTATFWYQLDDKRGEFPINANVKVSYKTQGQSSYTKVDDEFAKKVQTNAITKGLSCLGFNSDVFEGKFDDSKYVEQRRQEEAGNPTPPDTPKESKQPPQSSGRDIPRKDSDFVTALEGFKEALDTETFDRILGDTGYAGVPWSEIPDGKHGWIRNLLTKATEA